MAQSLSLGGHYPIVSDSQSQGTVVKREMQFKIKRCDDFKSERATRAQYFRETELAYLQICETFDFFSDG